MMALAPPSEPQGRISQLLPTVKCSNCGNPVRLAELGEHLCPPDSPSPRSLFSKSPAPDSRISQAPSISTIRTRSTSSASTATGRIPSLSPRSFARDSSSTISSPRPSFSSLRESRSPSSPPADNGKPPLGPLPATPTSPGSPGIPPALSPATSPRLPPTSPTSPGRAQISPRLMPTSAGQPITAGSSYFPPTSPISIPRTTPSPAPSNFSLSAPRSPEPDTKSGGAAGMAGVGRRGFAAVAHAALFTMPSHTGGFLRPNAPQFLDMTAAQGGPSTPPLTANSQSSGFSPTIPSPLSPTIPDALTPTRATYERKNPTDVSPVIESSPEVSTYRTPSPAIRRQNTVTSIGSESEYGLAYAESTDYEDQDEDVRELLRRSSSTRLSRLSRRKSTKEEKTPPLPEVPLPPTPKIEDSLDKDRTFSESPAPVVGDDKIVSPRYSLRDEGILSNSSGLSAIPIPPTPPSKGLPLRSRTVGGITSPKNDAVKLPARANTERGSHHAPGGTEKATRKRAKSCIRCEKLIEDGRWINVDGGGVLCERCWKNMYLPKCRRCNLPIEKQAVSSSDGQLKGKYHKDCFNCHTCQKPFPNKTFYVYDGKPFCAYHYHEANNSLCAAEDCGQPIEGPCAVSHNGSRYHPEHMLCEFAGAPSCKERLTEYWEIDGRMLCERHAKRASRGLFGLYDFEEDDDESRYGDDDEDDGVWMDGRALKRVTRFIDLGLGGNGLR